MRLLACPAVLLLCWYAWTACRARSLVVLLAWDWKQPLLTLTMFLLPCPEGRFCMLFMDFYNCNSMEDIWFFATGLVGIHGHYENWSEVVSFVRGHFKEIFTLWTIRVVICSSVSVFKQKHVLLSSHFMVWRTKSITNAWWNHSMSLWWIQESGLVWRRRLKGEDGGKDPIYFFLFVNPDCAT